MPIVRSGRERAREARVLWRAVERFGFVSFEGRSGGARVVFESGVAWRHSEWNVLTALGPFDVILTDVI